MNIDLDELNSVLPFMTISCFLISLTHFCHLEINIVVLIFLSLSLTLFKNLITITRTRSTMLNKTGRSTHLYFVPGHKKEAIEFFIIKYQASFRIFEYVLS